MLELKRIVGEWRTRLHRVQHILQPPQWTSHDWTCFAKALYALVKKYGNSWSGEGVEYWDIRWTLREGGELICQVEEKETQNSLVVAQSGGFARGVECYTWFYSEFSKEGNFMAEPYWVDGSWKEALAMILLPHQIAAGFYLTGSSVPLHTHLLPSAVYPEAAS
ncbi:MAG: hypothetical protein V1746_05375 [bacterium]